MTDKKNNFLDEDFAKRKQKKQKVTLFFLFSFSVFLILFSFWSLKNTIYNPFGIIKSDKGEVLLSSGDLNSERMQALMNMDTDGDGLSDYDEIYIYNTSPYLEDTDSDGYSDYEEVMIMNTDPLCPEGQDCSGLNDPYDSVTQDENEFDNKIPETDNEELSSMEDAILDGESHNITPFYHCTTM